MSGRLRICIFHFAMKTILKRCLTVFPLSAEQEKPAPTFVNNVNFDVQNRTAFTSNFGRIFSAGPSRQMQLAVKLHF